MPDFFFELMDLTATFIVETPFAALAFVGLLAALCWWGATACTKAQEKNG